MFGLRKGVYFNGYNSSRNENDPYYDYREKAFWSPTEKIWFIVTNEGTKVPLAPSPEEPNRERLNEIQDIKDKHSIVINSGGLQIITTRNRFKQECTKDWERNKSAILEFVANGGKLELTGNSFGAIKLFGFIAAIIEDQKIDEYQREKILDSICEINLQSPMLGSKKGELTGKGLSRLLPPLNAIMPKPSIQNYIEEITNLRGGRKLKCAINIYYCKDDEFVNYQGKLNRQAPEQKTNIHLIKEELQKLTKKTVNIIKPEDLQADGIIIPPVDTSITKHQFGFFLCSMHKCHSLKKYLSELEEKINKYQCSRDSKNQSLNTLLNETKKCLRRITLFVFAKERNLFHNKNSDIVSEINDYMYEKLENFTIMKIKNLIENIVIVAQSIGENNVSIGSFNIKDIIKNLNKYDISEILFNRIIANDNLLLDKILECTNKTNPDSIKFYKTIKDLHSEYNLFDNKVIFQEGKFVLLKTAEPTTTVGRKGGCKVIQSPPPNIKTYDEMYDGTEIGTEGDSSEILPLKTLRKNPLSGPVTQKYGDLDEGIYSDDEKAEEYTGENNTPQLEQKGSFFSTFCRKAVSAALCCANKEHIDEQELRNF